MTTLSTLSPLPTSSTPSTLTAISTIGPPPSNNGETMVMDDTDPSIMYFTPPGTSGWEVTTNGVSYNHTLHQTTCNICAATLLFNGTGVSMSALVSQKGSDFMAIIDGVFSGPFRLYNDVDQISIVYTVEGLANTIPHNITFMKMSSDGSSDAFFNIDSLTIISRPSVGSTSSTSATPIGRTTTPQTGAGSSETNVPDSPHAQSASSPPIGAIIGGTVGGLAVLGVVIAWIILMKRRRNQKAKAVVYYRQ
ncbi:hypothetical protein FRC20_008247 [Serendipita sp. 405]|nr:hypothetical protein FRC16_007982 [Serendipita sp. 398]KAG8866531.1 hypothetical protein FRC20_008247 [Serendipita sp. 405]